MTNKPLALVPAIEDRQIALTAEGEQLIARALEASALIGRVQDETENSLAVQAQVEIKTVINLLESTRVSLTKPALEFQRKVKAFFDTKADELKAEAMRVGKLSGSYAALLAQKQRAAEAAAQVEASALERERMAAIAKCESHEQVDAVQEHYNERAAIEAPAPPPVQLAKGQSIREDYEITVYDLQALARAHPGLVDIKPRLVEIKAAAKAGVKLAGVTATPIDRQVVRVARTEAIQV